jgi:hypothetical protein
MAKPIFLVGWRRSGTTWLGSLISQHTNVAAILGGVPGRGGGIVESAYFSHLAGKYGNLKYHNNLIRFIEVFCSSTYFELSGLEKDFLYKERPATYEGLFRLTMDRFAEKEGADFWIEKNPAHSFQLMDISRAYPDALFLSIERDIVQQVQSALKLIERINPGRKPIKGLIKKLTIFKEVIGYHAATKHIERFRLKHPDKILLVKYENLVKSRRKVINAICKFLGLDFQEDMLESKYKPATSFKSETERKRALSPIEIKMIPLLSLCFARVPYIFYRLLYLAKRKIEGQKLPFWYFSTTIERYGWDDIFGEGRERDLQEQGIYRS